MATWTPQDKYAGAPSVTYDDTSTTYDDVTNNYNGQEITNWTAETKHT